jgi:hypothetical protein
MSEIASLPLDDAAKLQAKITELWGFTPTLAYCEALIAFIEEMTGATPESR